MSAKKALMDVKALGGLSEKIDARRLPNGKQAKLENLVANKEGRYDKRLGFKPLANNTVAFPTGYTTGKGINLGVLDGRLLEMERGIWTPTGALVTALTEYSDDSGGKIIRGQLPEFQITNDSISCDTPNSAFSPSCTILGDYLIQVWIDATYVNGAANQFQYGKLYWSTIEISTGRTITPPSILYGGGQVGAFRVLTVGFNVVVVFNDYSNDGKLFAYAVSSTSLVSSLFPWGTLITLETNLKQTVSDPFDACAVDNDSAAFVLVWQTTGSPSDIFTKRFTVSAGVITGGTSHIVTVTTDTVTGFGLRAQANVPLGVGCIIVTWATAASTIWASVQSYPGMGSVTTPLQLSNVNIGGGTFNPPVWLDVSYSGTNGFGQLSADTWTISWSPWGAVWNSTTARRQGDPNRLVVTSIPPANFPNNARIGQAQVTFSGSTITQLSNVYCTPGVTLAGKGLEANGIIYYLAWVPSYTQGSFLVMAFDCSANPIVAGLPPMRPVANLQVRTALADPGTAVLPGAFSGYMPINAPNAWSGGAAWAMSGDHYATAYITYVGGTRGRRLQPALGALQTLPVQGYQSDVWGTSLAIAGALPVICDTDRVLEQSFLYAPESILFAWGTGGKSSGPTFATPSDTYSYIFTWEQFDTAGNFHISARSPAIVAAYPGATGTYNPAFLIPTLGPTLRQTSVGGVQNMFAVGVSTTTPVQLGCYRTAVDGAVFFRINDVGYDNLDGADPALTLNNFGGNCAVTYVDSTNDPTPTSGNPLLYDDGTNGAPGSLDNYCPKSTATVVRYKERLFTHNGNLVMFTKARGELQGPGFDEQVNSFYVGSDEPIVGLSSLDVGLFILKADAVYYVSGDGPADDGSGSSFSNPQLVPTDYGCSSAASIQVTSEGIYYMSAGGLRRISRDLNIEYVGGPIEDEIAAYPVVSGATPASTTNRYLLLVNRSDLPTSGAQVVGEILVRDYALDVWSTAVVKDGTAQKGFVAGAVSNVVFSGAGSLQTLHVLTADGTVWRERNATLDNTPYFDNTTYIQSTWLTPEIRYGGDQQNPGDIDQARFRIWDINLWGLSPDPHGLKIVVSRDYDVSTAVTTNWVWDSVTGAPSIAPTGTGPYPAPTQLRTYDGRMGETFQIQVQDVADSNASSGQGFQVLGLTVTLGVQPGPYKLPSGQTQ